MRWELLFLWFGVLVAILYFWAVVYMLTALPRRLYWMVSFISTGVWAMVVMHRGLLDPAIPRIAPVAVGMILAIQFVWITYRYTRSDKRTKRK